MTIILDTNFLLSAIDFKIDIFRDLENPIMLQANIDELNLLANSRRKVAGNAKLAIQMLEKKGIKIVKSKDKGDQAILNYVKDNKYAVATNDRKLIISLKKLNIKIIRFRQKKFLFEV